MVSLNIRTELSKLVLDKKKYFVLEIYSIFNYIFHLGKFVVLGILVEKIYIYFRESKFRSIDKLCKMINKKNVVCIY